MDRTYLAEGDASQVVVTDKDQGILAYKMDPNGKFDRHGTIPFGGYLSVYPQILVANTPTVLSLTDGLGYSIHAIGENTTIQLFFNGKGVKVYHAGDHIDYAFVMLQPDMSLNNGNEWIEQFRRQFGFNGILPYTLKVVTGKVDDFHYLLNLESNDGAVRLNVAKTNDLLMAIPTTVKGLNRNIAAGVYDTRTREFRHIAVDTDGVGYFEFDPNEGAKDLFIGNLVSCNQKAVKVDVISSGNGEANIVVHNPSDTDLKCIVTGNPSFPPLAGIRRELVVKAGTDGRATCSLAVGWQYAE
jgi:hypothetical protein